MVTLSSGCKFQNNVKKQPVTPLMGTVKDMLSDCTPFVFVSETQTQVLIICLHV